MLHRSTTHRVRAFCISAGQHGVATSALVLMVAACVVGGHRAAIADAALEGTNPAQWRLIWKSDPAHEATISWSTAEPGEKHQLHYKVADTAEFSTVECQRNGKFWNKKGGPDRYFHHARLTGLKPSTKYVVEMESDSRRSPQMHFITAPVDDRDVQLIFGGDSRSDRPARRKVNQMLSRMLAENPSIIAFAHGGDYIDTGTKFDQWNAWMTDHELTVTADGRMLPLIPTRGNHDGGPIFNQLFDYPKKDTNYYALNLSPQIRLVTLNTEISMAGDQAEWLDTELAASRPTHQWLLAQYHRPAYPALKFPSGAKTNWVPLFERHNLDIALEADGHSIKRTPPIRNDKVDSTGVVYVGEGGLGVEQRTPFADRWYLRSPGMASKGHHVQLLTFTKDVLTCWVILLDGTVFDEAAIVPHQQRLAISDATPEAVAAGSK